MGKKIALLIVLILFCSASTSFAQCNTYVPPGTIDGETWTLAGSPYCINGNLTIVDLVIEPGVIVEFLNNYSFTVEPGGVLIAAGTEGNGIIFRHHETNGVGWQGILFDQSSSSCQLTYCTVTGALNGGLRIVECTPTIESCIIDDNKGSSGAGISISLTSSVDDHLIIADCDITNNRSSSHAGGVRAIVEYGSLELLGCSIQYNLSNPSSAGGNYVGGGIYATLGLQGDILLNKCDVSDNTVNSHCYGDGCSVTARGGGIYKDGLGYVTLENCSINNNLAYAVEHGGWGNEHAYGRGGGVYVNEGAVVALNSFIGSNTAKAHGAYAYTYGGGCYTNLGLLRLTNCTVVENAAHTPGYGSLYAYGGGLYKDGSSNMIVTNSIIYSNVIIKDTTTSPSQIYGNPTVTYSCVQDGYTGEGNIEDDPIFATGPLGDYYLSQTAAGQAEDSPCVDAGDPATDPWGWILLTTRTDQGLDTGIVDMGYHYYLLCTDEDEDGYSIEGGVCGPIDCDDTDGNVYPGAPENCENGFDDDCDLLVDCDDPDCPTPPCPWRIPTATAATYGSDSVTGSGILNHLALLLIPAGAVIGLGIWRRRR